MNPASSSNKDKLNTMMWNNYKVVKMTLKIVLQLLETDDRVTNIVTLEDF